MNELLGGLKRSHMCAEVTNKFFGTEVTVMGWVHRIRNLGSLFFISLRDRSGFVQVVVGEEHCKDFSLCNKIRTEFVVAITGNVEKRTEENINRAFNNGDIEIAAKSIKILSQAEVLPFPVEEVGEVNEALRLKHRYIDLRRPEIQKKLLIRHRAAQLTRNYFAENGFIEIETPVLTKSTPEGARDYLVPSRIHQGKFYALPQSPQLFKQLLMVSGFDRYMQIVKCFRDEDLRADRQPEFTQIDLEMSFVDVDDVISINEGFLKRLFEEIMGIEVKLPFLRLTYDEAMQRFGSDKPDIRFGFEIQDVSHIVKDSGFKVFEETVKNGGSVRGINVNGYADSFSRKDIDALGEVAKLFKAKGLAWAYIGETENRSSFAKFLAEGVMDNLINSMKARPGDLLLFVADKDEVALTALGQVRLEVAKKLQIAKNNNEFKFLWVTDFPLFEYDEEEGRYIAKHHPFTAPKDEDIDLLEKSPEKVRAKAYDIVLNGVEIGGGSIRIHSKSLQTKMFKCLGFTEEQAVERFGFLLEAFKYGTPPHGGIAFGFDRLVMFLSGTEDIRDVIAFPKVKNASCLMSGAPSEVENKQLEELGIDVRIKEK